MVMKPVRQRMRSPSSPTLPIPRRAKHLKLISGRRDASSILLVLNLAEAGRLHYLPSL